MFKKTHANKTKKNRKRDENDENKTIITTIVVITIIRTTTTQQVFDKKNISIIAIAIFQKQKTMRKANSKICNVKCVKKRFAIVCISNCY